MKAQERIRLKDVEGIARLSGTDEYGNIWLQFEVDHLAEQEEGECCICEAVLEEGWLCLDGGEEVCYEHVTFTDQHSQVVRIDKD